MNDIWFTSDTHFDHFNIIRHCNRVNPNTGLLFVCADEMNEYIIGRWNSNIKKGDTVYHLGDFSWSTRVQYFLDRLHGQIHLIRGNHDANIAKKDYRGFAWVGDLKYKTIGGVKMYLSHCSHRVWFGSHRGSIHLFGHSHGTMTEISPRSMDVGVDTNLFSPYSIDEVLAETGGSPGRQRTDFIACTGSSCAFKYLTVG